MIGAPNCPSSIRCCGLLVEAVGAERQGVVQQLLLHAEVVVVGAFGNRRRVQRVGAGRHRGRAGELGEGLGADQLERRRREITRVAAVHGRAGIELPHEVDARAQLTAARVGAVVIEAQAIVEGEGRCDLPLVLQVGALDDLRLRTVIGHGEWHVAGLRSRGIDRQHLRGGVALRAVVLDV